MTHNLVETIMGAVVLLVALFFVGFAYKTSGFENRSGFEYSASFDRIDGLVIGADVRMSGVKVGIIKSLEVNKETFLASVTFTVDEAISLPKDTSAEIISDGLMGSKFLALVPGGDDENLKPGDKIKHTQSSVLLESLIGQLIFSKKGDEKEDSSSKKDAHTHE